MCCSSMFKNSAQHTALSYLPERLHYRILSPEPAEPLPALSSPCAGFFFVESVKAVCEVHFTHGPAPAQLASLVLRWKLRRKSIVFNGVLTLFILWDLCGNFTLMQNKQLEPEAGGLSPAPYPCGPQSLGPSGPHSQPSSGSGGRRKPDLGGAGRPGAPAHGCHLLGGGSLHLSETRFSQL